MASLWALPIPLIQLKIRKGGLFMYVLAQTDGSDIDLQVTDLKTGIQTLLDLVDANDRDEESPLWNTDLDDLLARVHQGQVVEESLCDYWIKLYLDRTGHVSCIVMGSMGDSGKLQWLEASQEQA
jgi:hypothetical protein